MDNACYDLAGHRPRPGKICAGTVRVSGAGNASDAALVEVCDLP